MVSTDQNGHLTSQKSVRYNYAAHFGDGIDALMSELKSMLLQGSYILTPELRDFERAFASYCGCSFARGVNTGTDAILITLRALGIGQGDEVITQANTFHATVAAIELSGATPVLVDAEEGGFLMDVAQVPAVITPRTFAIIPVHLCGKPTPMRRLLDIAKRTGAHLVEDAAQAHGAIIDGRRVGSFGIAGCFSFHPSKNLAAAGDAGAIVTSSEILAERIDRTRALGQRAQNEHVEVGFNSKMDSLQARILSWKLKQLDSWNCARARASARYRELLSGLPVSFQSTNPNEEHVYHLFQIRTSQRDALLDFLRKSDVDAVVRYPTPIHLQPAFVRWGWRRGQFPVAEKLAEELLCLPIRPDMEGDEIEFVARRVRAFFEHHGRTDSLRRSSDTPFIARHMD
jgi:dTDP-4-amino-4,6-dideoxygalactose transaminase